MENIVEKTVIPEHPSVSISQPLNVHVPVATNNKAGIASFSNDDFTVSEDGEVKIKNEAITDEKIATETISGDKLQDKAVTTKKIEDNSINSDKLDSDLLKILLQSFSNVDFIKDSRTFKFCRNDGKTATCLSLVLDGMVFEEELKGFINGIVYDEDTYKLTFKIKGEENPIEVDLPIEALVSSVEKSYSNVDYDESTGKLTFTGNDGKTSKTVDLPLELLVSSGAYNSDTKQIELTLANKTDVIRIDLKDLADKIDVQIKDGSITTSKIADEAVTEDKIADNAVATNYDSKGNVVNSKIKKDAVYTEAIRDETVTSEKIADQAVTGKKIANYTVSAMNLKDNSIGYPKLESGTTRTDLKKSFSNASYDGHELKLTPNDGEITTIVLPLNELEKRIETLEGLTLTKITDDTVAYEKVVPADVGSRAAINKVGCMSYKSRNLCIADKVYELNNDSYLDLNLGELEAGEYTLFFVGNFTGMQKIHSSYVTDMFFGGNPNKEFSIVLTQKTNVMVTIMSEYEDTGDDTLPYLNGTITGIMLCPEDEEDKSYEPYFDGYIKPTSIESRGANLIPFPYRGGGVGTVHTHNGITFTVNEDRSITIKGTATGLSYIGLCLFDFGDTNINAVSGDNTNGIYAASKRLFYNSTQKVLTLQVVSGTTVNETVYPMLNRGTTVAPYTPYSAEPIDTFEIPEAVQSLEGWGLGINAEYNNHIEWRNGRVFYIQMLEEFDLANVGEWKLNSLGTFYTHPALTPMMHQMDFKVYPRTEIPIGLSSKYEVVSINQSASSSFDKVISYGTTDTKYINVRDSAYTDVETFTNAMNGVKLVYALETPIETDVTEYFPSYKKYFYMNVQPGGTLKFINDGSNDVPSTVTYVKKL